MAADIKPFQNILTPSPVEDESALGRFLRTAKAYNIPLDSSTLGIAAMADAFGGPKTPGYSDKGGLKEQWDDLEERQKRQADYRQELGKQSTGQVVLANTINKLGSTLSTALGGPSWDTIERNRLTGLEAINKINPPTIQPVSIAQFQPKVYYS